MNKTERESLAARLAENSIVLLKNENDVLPLASGDTIAVFGRAQTGTLFSGNGSGGAHVAGCQTLLEACEETGLVPEPLLKGFYAYKFAGEPVSEADEFDWTKVSEMVNSGIMYEIFGRYRPPVEEFEIPDTLAQQAAEKTDTALLVLGRNSGGEECDRHKESDYFLTASEEKLVATVCRHFLRVVVVLNTNGLVDLSWMEKYPSVKAILFAGIPGEQGAGAVARILSGQVNPSGKLAFTIARRYEDYPSAAHFSWDKDHLDAIRSYEEYGLSAAENGSTDFAKSPVTVYQEGIYNGYRYFDSFGKDALYPFGYGLSYTTFDLLMEQVVRTETGLQLQVRVCNTGHRSGKEVVQVYLSRTETARVERPAQELKGFAKTSLLKPGEKETLTISIPWRALAAYEEETANWVIEAGEYLLRAGNASRENKPVARLLVREDIVTEHCHNRLGLAPCNREKLKFLSGANKTAAQLVSAGLPTITLCAADLPAPAKPAPVTAEIPPVLNTLSDRELAALCVGYGAGTPFSAVGDRSDPPTIYSESGAPLTVNDHPTGFEGYVSPAIPQAGIHSIFYKDGPAGVGGLAWPTEMLLACSFDRSLWQAFGSAVASECEEQGVNIWLAPAVNLHRDPLCGRNFEYFSEDPLLTGLCACEIARGVQQNGRVFVCPKHLAANEQETFRRGSAKRRVDAVDSILPERALRELYLLPFEMLVRQANVRCIMTSFNKINGVFAGGSQDLCTHILREEWGFSGAVVTDWGDMDIVVDGADAVAAGNDIVMPGGPPVIAQLLRGLKENRLTRQQLLLAVSHLMALLQVARGNILEKGACCE